MSNLPFEPYPYCMDPSCFEPPTCTLTFLVGYDPEKASLPGNGRLISWRYCDECAEATKQDMLLAATDSTQFVCIIPDRMPVV